MMRCFECDLVGDGRAAVALCRFCFVGLCSRHLADVSRNRRTFPQYACHHDLTAGAAREARAPMLARGA